MHADEDEDDGTFKMLQFPLVTMVIEINAMGKLLHCFGMWLESEANGISIKHMVFDMI